VLLDELGEAGGLDWSRVSVDSFSLRAVRGDQVGANPVDRAKPGSKLHLAADSTGLPLAVLVTAANTNDAVVFEALVDDIPRVRTPAVRIARRGVESSERLGRHRWKAERTIAWLAGYRRLRIRYDRDSERFVAFAMLAYDRLCSNRLPCVAIAQLP
jgi:transposase